ncbi:MAG: PDC sensor domain-containing protein [Gammaproteobacteria bacterium]|nr:PDC sensor domain-containing protein [Gammaproteobacteria bacterium]
MTDPNSVHTRILAKKEQLAKRIKQPLAELAEMCSEVWPEQKKIDEILRHEIGAIPDCGLLYAWDVEGQVVSCMILPDSTDDSWLGRDLHERPYLSKHLPYMGIMLSSVYRSDYDGRECITALQAVNRDNQLLGFVAADFSVNELLRDSDLPETVPIWNQYKGDPAVRGTLFLQERFTSQLDEHIDEILSRFEILIAEHGVFHVKIHFSSGRCSIWLMDNPYSYRILTIDELLDPDLSLAYPWRPYTSMATITADQVKQCFEQFKHLRFGDETIYLRSSSVNIINGMVGLTFSCDGSHYMPMEDFLEKEQAFWFGDMFEAKSDDES